VSENMKLVTSGVAGRACGSGPRVTPFGGQQFVG